MNDINNTSPQDSIFIITYSNSEANTKLHYIVLA